MPELVYALHWAVVLLALLLSWRGFRDVLHPHFLFTVAACTMFFSDFLVRGYDVSNLRRDLRSDLLWEQLLVLGIFCVVLSIAGLLSRRARSPLFTVPASTMAHAGAIGRGLIIAWLLLLAEILKRLAAVGWHLETAISQTMGPRGGRAWQSKLVFVGDDTFFYVLIGAVLPFAGLIFAYALVYLRGWQRIRATIGLIIVLALLISSGDRTPTLFVLGSLILFVMHARWSLWLRSTLAAAILLSGAMAVSIMYLYRGEGLSHLLADDSKATASLVYHQDDSYYRALVAIDMSGRTSQRWDWGSFFAAALVNPIPRYFWPEKPILPKNFWGAYKSYWITITYLGELAAMFGPWGVSILGVVFGVGLFLLLGWSARALNRETGILFYLVMALYVYMVMRSLLNLSQFIYLPLMSWWAVLFFISPHSGRGHGSGQVLSGARS